MEFQILMSAGSVVVIITAIIIFMWRCEKENNDKPKVLDNENDYDKKIIQLRKKP